MPTRTNQEPILSAEELFQLERMLAEYRARQMAEGITGLQTQEERRAPRPPIASWLPGHADQSAGTGGRPRPRL
jgi:hypothetical protein